VWSRADGADQSTIGDAVKYKFRTSVVIVALASVVAAVGLLIWSVYKSVRPHAVFEFAFQGSEIRDMHFAPDGAAVAVVTVDSFFGKWIWRVRIYGVADGKLLHELKGGALKCAWSPDGLLLAVARDNWPDVDVWDTRTWSLKSRLPLVNPAKGRATTDEPLGGLIVSGLCFDRNGNLYVAEIYSNMNGFSHRVPHLTVWWGAGPDHSEIDPSLPYSYEDFSVSTGGVADEIRVACSYATQPLHIWTIRTRRNGERVIQPAFEVPKSSDNATHQAESRLPKLIMASVALTPDGRYLAARDMERFYIFELSDEHVRLIHSREDPFVTKTNPFVQLIDISLDGRLAAYRSKDRNTVVRLPDGKTALMVEGRSSPIALSPDGRLLAIADNTRKTICFYRIPEDSSEISSKQ
jgi:WD40 repeat protein